MFRRVEIQNGGEKKRERPTSLLDEAAAATGAGRDEDEGGTGIESKEVRRSGSVEGATESRRRTRREKSARKTDNERREELNIQSGRTKFFFADSASTSSSPASSPNERSLVFLRDATQEKREHQLVRGRVPPSRSRKRERPIW